MKYYPDDQKKQKAVKLFFLNNLRMSFKVQEI